MARLMRNLVEVASSVGGTFFLPCQLRYTPTPLERFSPMIRRVFAAKRPVDADGVFSSTWYERHAPAFGS
jgi:hypothetical protein